VPYLGASAVAIHCDISIVCSFYLFKKNCRCCVSVGEIFFEIKTEADSNDTTECRHDDELSAGMFVFFVRIFCDDLLLLSSTTNAWSDRNGGSLCTYQCYFSYGFSVSVSVIVVIYQLQFQLQLCIFLFFSFSYSCSFSVTVTVIVFQFLFLFQLVILHKICISA